MTRDGREATPVAVDFPFEKVSNKREAREECQFKGFFPSQTRALCLLSEWNLRVEKERRCGRQLWTIYE